MTAALTENRPITAAAIAAVSGALLLRTHPFPADDPLLRLIEIRSPGVHTALFWSWSVMLFTTPYFLAASFLSGLFVFGRWHRAPVAGSLPPYPDPDKRTRLEVVIGELHHQRRIAPSAEPGWLILPDRGLYTGTAVFGAIGSGKTTSCMYTFAEQILSYRKHDPALRPAGLLLEVKGDFCHQVREILERHGRGGDYKEITIGGDLRYNPLHNDLEPYAMAYGIATTLNNLFGRSKEPFWQQAYTNLVKFLIHLHLVLYDYVTLWDVYACAINPDRTQELIRKGEALFALQFIVMDANTYVQAANAHPEIERLPLAVDEQLEDSMRCPLTESTRQILDRAGLQIGQNYEILSESGGPAITDDVKREKFGAVRRWFYNDWRRIEPKLRTSIVEGISVFLSLFDDDPSVRRTFCPQKECYDPVANADGRYGTPMLPISQAIEAGAVIALNFPLSSNPGLARAIGTMLKQDFQRAVLGRIPRLDPAEEARSVLFLCDEYQSFATVGESDPSGDEKFFALSRAARCVPLVATQSISSLRSTLPGESWRTLLQTFRTKIFLGMSDDASARIASDLCGRIELLKESYSLSGSGQDARVSLITGKATAHKASVTTSKTYSVQMLPRFEPGVFSELPNAVAIVLAYDGSKPLPPQYVFLKPHYLDRNMSYFEQNRRGLL